MLRKLTRRPALRALAGTLAGNLPGLLLPFLITARVEAGRLTDAYFFAFALVVFGTTIVSLTLENNVVPVAAYHRRQGPERLRRFVLNLLARCTAWTAGGYVVVGTLVAGTLLLRDNWTGDEKRLCVELIGIFAFFLLALSTTSVLSGSLYAFGSFFVTTLTIGVRSVLPIAPLFLARDPETALLLSAAALAVGEWLRAALLWHLLRRAIRAMPAAAPGDAGLGDPPTVWSTALPYGMAMVLMGSVQVVDRVVAGALDPGAITTIDLAEKVFYAPVKILTTSVLLVAGARWAGMVLEQPEDVASDFWQTVRRAALLACALAGAIVVAVAVVLLTVDATVAGVDAGEFGVVLGILMIGFPAAVVTNAGVRLLTVLRRTRVFPRLGIVAFTTSVLGSVVGAATLGTAGIALSGTVWRIVNTALFLSFGAAALRRMGAPEQAGGSDAARPSAVLYPVRMES